MHASCNSVLQMQMKKMTHAKICSVQLQNNLVYLKTQLPMLVAPGIAAAWPKAQISKAGKVGILCDVFVKIFLLLFCKEGSLKKRQKDW